MLKNIKKANSQRTSKNTLENKKEREEKRL